MKDKLLEYAGYMKKKKVCSRRLIYGVQGDLSTISPYRRYIQYRMVHHKGIGEVGLWERTVMVVASKVSFYRPIFFTLILACVCALSMKSVIIGCDVSGTRASL